MPGHSRRLANGWRAQLLMQHTQLFDFWHRFSPPGQSAYAHDASLNAARTRLELRKRVHQLGRFASRHNQ